MVERIRDIEISRRIDLYVARIAQLRRNRRSSIARVPWRTATRHSRNRAVWRDFPDALIEFVSDVKVARRIHRHAAGIVQRSPKRGSAVAGKSALAVARDDNQASVWREAHHHVVAGVGHVEIALRIDR